MRKPSFLNTSPNSPSRRPQTRKNRTPTSVMFPYPPPQRGEIAESNRSRRLFDVLQFFSSLNPHLPPERRITAHLESNTDPDSAESVIAVMSPSGMETPIGAFTIVSEFERDDIPSLASISDEYLEDLEKARHKVEQLSPQEAAERYPSLIYVAVNFFVAYEDDKQKAIIKALEGNDLIPLRTLTQDYGYTGFPFEEVGSCLLRKAANGDPEATEVVALLTREKTGRKRTVSEEEKREKGRERKKTFGARVRTTAEKLITEIERQISRAKIPQETLRNSQRMRAFREKTAAEVLAPFLAGKGYKRKAAQQAQEHFRRPQ